MKEIQLSGKRKYGQSVADTPENPELDWMTRAGITDGSRAGDYATREETARMIAAALRYWTDCVFRILNGEMQQNGG